jgi:small subunit ribosomal protein S17
MSKSLQKNIGTVVTKSGNKTIKVEVVSSFRHKMYKKVVTRSVRLMVHDENNEASIGDTVSFVPCRPISRRKTWRMFSIIGDKQ